MFRTQFSHFLSYGATDQKTVIDLAETIDGLLVPGTVAAFQRDGTGGFVLTLSASASNLKYVIDPRFPLFQQAILNPKKSHEALATLLGVPQLVRSTQPTPDDFTHDVIKKVASSWVTFNEGYIESSGNKFAKYAKRLGEAVPLLENVADPLFILPPYLISHAHNDKWWEKSKSLFSETISTVSDPSKCVRVIACSDPSLIELHGQESEEMRLALWVSGLNEIEASADDLAIYGRSIRSLSSSGKSTFALYGGFFSVLLHNVGLGGASHGIGFGEHRAWVELPQSGPPPARYYVPQLHRYLQPDEATRLLLADRRLAECDCPECADTPPNVLEYHALMKHSVHCRKREIDKWANIGLDAATHQLEKEHTEWKRILLESGLPEVISTNATIKSRHVATWIEALRRIEGER